MQRSKPGLELPFGDAPARLAAPAARRADAAPAPSRWVVADGEPPRRDDADADVVGVAELDRRLRRLVEGATAGVQVVGEVGGLRVVASGHSYFTLKDEREEAVVDCVMYRAAPVRARRLLADGAKIVVTGRATVWAPRGKLQLVVDDARPRGRGALLEALERLKAVLAAEGLFDPARKRTLPPSPAVIGVVTSADGAALHDIVTVAFRRGGARILLARAPVQGAGAAARMARALAMLARVPSVDVIVLARGGGSAEDLSAFNDEALVRQVAASPVPVVSAVGHEIDLTLTDLVADARAATPSQAAEMLVADGAARRDDLAHQLARLRRALLLFMSRARSGAQRLRAALASPEALLSRRRVLLDAQHTRLAAALRRAVAVRRAEQARVDRRLASVHPRAVVSARRADLAPLGARLPAAMRALVETERRVLGRHAARLEALSPLAVLSRGYAIATDAAGNAIRDAREVAVGDALTIRVHRGLVAAVVTRSEGPAGEGEGKS